jgi:hypothetical protein
MPQDKPNLFDLLHENALADTELLRRKDESGDIFRYARDVDFAFKTLDEKRARDLAEYINGKSFGAASVRGGEDGVFWILVVISMPITQQVLNCTSAFMLCLSRLFQVEYDGWGSVAKSDGASLG